MLKQLLGMSPQPTGEAAYKPSKFALWMSTSSKTDFQPAVLPEKQRQTPLKILVVCTEESHLVMANGKKFLTGNHPVELFVPMLHWQHAGFECDMVTPTGNPVKLEMWAMPEKDKNVREIYNAYKPKLAKPLSLQTLAAGNFAAVGDYDAIFIPGGHGALLGLPLNAHLGALIHKAIRKELLIMAICHGPAALLAAGAGGLEEPFVFKGYKMAVFPDAVDKQSPSIGYMPGQLTWFFGKELKKRGVTIINDKADDSCIIDRRLLTGASPKAANKFGQLSTLALLEGAPVAHPAMAD